MENPQTNSEATMASIMVGTIMAYASPTTPKGWLPCDGASIDPHYRELIEVLGGTSTPDLRGRALIGIGRPSNNKQSDGRTPNFDASTNFTSGYTGGEYEHKLSVDEMPTHSHTIYGGNFGIHGRSFEGEDGGQCPFESSPTTKLDGTDSTGGNGPHNNMQPYYAVNYIIFAGSWNARD